MVLVTPWHEPWVLDIGSKCSTTKQHHQPQQMNVVKFMSQDLLRKMKCTEVKKASLPSNSNK